MQSPLNAISRTWLPCSLELIYQGVAENKAKVIYTHNVCGYIDSKESLKCSSSDDIVDNRAARVVGMAVALHQRSASFQKSLTL